MIIKSATVNAGKHKIFRSSSFEGGAFHDPTGLYKIFVFWDAGTTSTKTEVMRQNHGSKRSRGRNSNRRNGPSRNQTFDSNGPSVRIRGNAVQVHEKYLTMARDASSSGDRISAENFLQHAEHYYRILAAQREEAEARGEKQQNQRQNGSRRNRQEETTENVEDNVETSTAPTEQPESDVDEMPAFVTKKVPELAETEPDTDEAEQENTVVD